MIASLNLYFHDENSVGTATDCYLLVRGTNNGQRRLTARKVNCTAHGRSTAFAEETTLKVASRSRDETGQARLGRKKPYFRPIA